LCHCRQNRYGTAHWYRSWILLSFETSPEKVILCNGACVEPIQTSAAFSDGCFWINGIAEERT
jgi:hypothetical protein